MRELLSAFAVIGIGSLVTAALGAVTNKLVAVAGGVEGTALYGQLRNLVQLAVTLATLNGRGSLVRGVAGRNGKDRLVFAGAVGLSFLVGGVACALALTVGAPAIAASLFAEPVSSVIIAVRLAAAAVIAGVVSLFLLGVANGIGALRAMIACQVVGAMAAALVAYPLALRNEPVAYLCIIGTGFATTAAAAGWWLARRTKLAVPDPAAWAGWREAVRDHLGQAGALLAVGLSGSGAVLLIRTLHIREYGLEVAGLFEAAWTISTAYLALLLTAFGTYYMPILSRCKGSAEARRVMVRVFRLVTVLGALLVTGVMMFKTSVLIVLYSEDFSSAVEILRWMLIGDYLKITGWVFGGVILAFRRNVRYLMSEALLLTTLCGLVYVGLPRIWNIAGPAYLAANAVYLAYVWRCVQQNEGLSVPRGAWRAWIAGAAMVCGTAWVTWSDRHSLGEALVGWTAAAMVLLWVASSLKERRRAWEWLRSVIHG